MGSKSLHSLDRTNPDRFLFVIVYFDLSTHRLAEYLFALRFSFVAFILLIDHHPSRSIIYYAQCLEKRTRIISFSECRTSSRMAQSSSNSNSCTRRSLRLQAYVHRSATVLPTFSSLHTRAERKSRITNESSLEGNSIPRGVFPHALLNFVAGEEPHTGTDSYLPKAPSTINPSKRPIESNSNSFDDPELGSRTRHGSPIVKRRPLSTTSQALKRQRDSSSDDDDHDSDPHSESTDTGNLCVRRRSGRPFSHIDSSLT